MKYPEFPKRFLALVLEQKTNPSQAEIGKWLGVSQPTINSWLAGEALPGMNKATDVALKLNCCVEYLLTGRGPKRPGVDLTDETHRRIMQALVSAKAAIDHDGSQIAKDRSNELYRFAVDMALSGRVSDEHLQAFIAVMSAQNP